MIAKSSQFLKAVQGKRGSFSLGELAYLARLSRVETVYVLKELGIKRVEEKRNRVRWVLE